jgi:hypothetical protein
MDLRSKDAIESSKQHDIKIGNILIAEFMGLDAQILSTNNVHSWSDAPFYYITEDSKEKVMEGVSEYSKYHKSWDWLMPVVEKIESDERYDVDILQYGTRISDNQKEIVNNIANISFDKKIDHTYQAVVEFIKNQNN